MKLPLTWLKNYISKIELNGNDITGEVFTGAIKSNGGFTTSVTEEGKTMAEKKHLNKIEIFIPEKGWAVCTI